MIRRALWSSSDPFLLQRKCATKAALDAQQAKCTVLFSKQRLCRQTDRQRERQRERERERERERGIVFPKVFTHR